LQSCITSLNNREDSKTLMQNTRKQITKDYSVRHLVVVLTLFLFFALFQFIFHQDNINGIIKIFTNKDILLSDYVAIGGLGSTLINATLAIGLCLIIIKRNEITVTGYVYASVLMTAGFAFFGKNIYNVLPIYLGVYLYGRYTKTEFRRLAAMAFFSSCLAPISTIGLPYGWSGLLLSNLLNVGVGFIICAVAANIIRFHNGYLLYNFGFAAGMVAIVVIGALRTFGMELDPVYIVSDDLHVHLVLVVLAFSISSYLLISGLLNAPFDWERYKKLLSMSGRAVTDYKSIFGEATMLVNMGAVGLIMTIVALLLRVNFNGPIIGAILTAIGYGAFGKNPRNVLPVMAGCVIMMLLSKSPIATSQVIAILFVTGIAPIAGEYGVIVGIIAGMMHFSLVQFTSFWQGSVNLYNNGFAAGFVAGIINSVMENIRRESE